MEEVRRERRGAALWLTINRESRRNALNEDVLRALREGVEGARIEDGIRAVVITGAGKVFCAGGDLKPDASGDPFRVDPAELDNPVVLFFQAVSNCAVPVIARVNGHALAGTAQLLTA